MYIETKGFVEICYKSGHVISININTYDQVITAIDSGRSYIDVEDDHGAEGRVWLDDINCIFNISAEARNAKRLEESEREKGNSLS